MHSHAILRSAVRDLSSKSTLEVRLMSTPIDREVACPPRLGSFSSEKHPFTRDENEIGAYAEWLISPDPAQLVPHEVWFRVVYSSPDREQRCRVVVTDDDDPAHIPAFVGLDRVDWIISAIATPPPGCWIGLGPRLNGKVYWFVGEYLDKTGEWRPDSSSGHSTEIWSQSEVNRVFFGS